MSSERRIKTYLRVFGDFLCGEMSDQRICLKFCVKNGIKCSEAFKVLKKAFDDDVMSLLERLLKKKEFHTARAKKFLLIFTTCTLKRQFVDFAPAKQSRAHRKMNI